MKRFIFSILLLTIAAQMTTAQSSAEAEIRKASDKEVDAFMRVDPKTLESLWSNEFVVTNPLNKFVTGKQVIGMVTSGMLAFKSYERTIEYFRQYDDIAVVAGSETVVWAGKMPLAGKESHLRYTAVWKKQNGTWKEIARHANIVDPPRPESSR